MPSSQKTFRVFVSSTFTDMRAERRILQEKVFPDLKKYCEARGASFQAVDLRWGVNEESQREQKTMEICLTEIARCQKLSPRPNFIVLLGDRYGWQPVPNKIPSDEMEQLQAHFSEEEASLIDEWYLEDTNALPPEYVLQPRGQEYRDYDQWQPVEDSLRATLRKVAAQTGFMAEQKIKYFASATHQEIINGALQTPDTGIDTADHVFGYLRELDSPPHGETAGDYLDLLPDGAVDLYAKAQMRGLKQELRDKLPQNHIYTYPARWHDGVHFDDSVLEAFGDRVYRDLVSIIDQELQQIIVVDELTKEKKNQEDFAQRLTMFFTGQEEPRRKIATYLEEGGDKPLAVLGPSGSGKSCLMARALKDGAEGFPGVIIYRFIGATAASSNPLLLLQRVCAEIVGAYDTDLRSLLQEGEDDKKLGTYGGLSQLFPRCLDLATEDRPLLIFLDALDQHKSHLFDFLPRTLPPHVRIVVSALSDLEDRLTFAEVYRLPPMPEPDGEALMGKWLAAEGRTLDSEQRQEVMGKFRIDGLPLYLKLAFEQVRQWHSYDAGKVLPADVKGILAGYFDLLEKEHSQAMVGKVAGYLLSGKYQGLAEAEILDLLVFDQEYWEGFVKGSHPAHRGEIEELRKLPAVVWSRLFLDLEPYLTELDADGIPVITFYHRKFLEYAEERYWALPPGAEGDEGTFYHATLAGYFETLPLHLDETEEDPNVRKVLEQPYQETLAGRWQALANNSQAHFPFLMTKTKAALVEGILEDYGLAFEKMPENWREKLKFWEAFFRERAHILRRGNEDWPAYKILLQLAMEHADDSPVTQGAEGYLAVGKCTWPWLRRERRPEHVSIDPCIAVLEGHFGFVVTGAIVVPGSRILSWAGDKILRLWDGDGKPLGVFEGHAWPVKGALVLPDRRILSWSHDDTLRLWDLNGKPLAVLQGHSSEVNGALALSDERILSWSNDHTLRLWNWAGKPLEILEGHTRSVTGALTLTDEWILSWSEDKTLRLWDRNGMLLAVLEGHSGAIDGALSLPGDRILSWSLSDNTLKLWDRVGKPLGNLWGHNNAVVRALLLSGDEILSWSWDKTLRLWDRTGKPLAVLEGHTSSVNGALQLPDGHVLSWSHDHTLRLWDLDGEPLAVFGGHSSGVNGALVLPDERILSWSNDHTLRLWNWAGKPLDVFAGHTYWVDGALAMPDGRILSWSGDETLRLWDPGRSWDEMTLRTRDKDGKPLENYSQNEGMELVYELMKSLPDGTPYLRTGNNFVILAGRHMPDIVWHGVSRCAARRLYPDGRAEVTQANGEVCFLQLYHGNRPITLDELEALDTAKAGCHHTAGLSEERAPETAV